MAEQQVNKIADDFIVVWLDCTADKTRDGQDTKALIRRMVRGRLLTFAVADQCVDRILVELSTKRIYFIVSNLFGPDIVSVIHDLPQIQTIYVYCGNRQAAESWTKPYQKVSGIFTEKQTLLHRICDELGACDKDGDLPMSVFHLEERQQSLQNLTEESTKFMWYQSIIMVLRLMAKYGNSKTEMIEECRANYHKDETEKKKINDFEQNYNPTKAFWWYTYDSFVYRLLNKALRTQNIEIIFKFRFFINDLHNQIQRLYQQYLTTHSSHTKKRLTVYRGQRMTMSELDLLRNNVNELISMNSFLSATTIREIAEVFADASDQCNESSPLQSVVFVIDICDISSDTTAFAFIQNYSCCQDEEEVLFTIGAIFKVELVKKDENIWRVHLQLNKQYNQQYKDLSSYMMKQIGQDPSPSTLGWFLYRMCDFNKAERYTQLLLKELPSNDIEVANAHNLLGLIYKDLKRLPESVTSYEKALEIYSHSTFKNSSQVIAIHYNLGLTYLSLDDDRSADEHQREAAEKLLTLSHKTDPLLEATTVALKGKVQIARGDYRNAYVSFKAVLQRKRKRLPADHPSIASTLIDMGIVEENMGMNRKALDYFTQALEIRRKSLSSDHLDIAECLRNIGRIHDKCKQHALASKQFELASKIAMNDIRE